MTDDLKYGPETATVEAFLRHLKALTPAAWGAAGSAAWRAAWGARSAAWGGTNEIQGAALMRARGQPFYFLPLFGFATPEDIK